MLTKTIESYVTGKTYLSQTQKQRQLHYQKALIKTLIEFKNELFETQKNVLENIIDVELMTTDNKSDTKQLIDTTFATIIDSPNAETDLIKETIQQTVQQKQSKIVMNTRMANTLKQLYLEKSNYDNETRQLIKTLITPNGDIHPTIKTHQLDTTHLSTILQQKLSTKETLIAELDTQKNIKQQDNIDESTTNAIE